MSFTRSLDSELNSTPSSLAVAFSSVSPARDSLTAHVAPDMNLSQISMRAIDNVQKAEEGLRALNASENEVAPQQAGTFKQIGLEATASVAAAPAMAGIAVGLGAINPALGVAFATGAVLQQTAKYASIGVQALSSNTSHTQNHSSDLNTDFDNDDYTAFADSLDTPKVSKYAMPSPVAMEPPKFGKALYWADTNEEKLAGDLFRQRDHNLEMIDNVDGLNTRRALEFPRPTFALAA